MILLWVIASILEEMEVFVQVQVELVKMAAWAF